MGVALAPAQHGPLSSARGRRVAAGLSAAGRPSPAATVDFGRIRRASFIVICLSRGNMMMTGLQPGCATSDWAESDYARSRRTRLSQAAGGDRTEGLLSILRFTRDLLWVFRHPGFIPMKAPVMNMRKRACHGGILIVKA